MCIKFTSFDLPLFFCQQICLVDQQGVHFSHTAHIGRQVLTIKQQRISGINNLHHHITEKNIVSCHARNFVLNSDKDFEQQGADWEHLQQVTKRRLVSPNIPSLYHSPELSPEVKISFKWCENEVFLLL